MNTFMSLLWVSLLMGPQAFRPGFSKWPDDRLGMIIITLLFAGKFTASIELTWRNFLSLVIQLFSSMNKIWQQERWHSQTNHNDNNHQLLLFSGLHSNMKARKLYTKTQDQILKTLRQNLHVSKEKSLPRWGFTVKFSAISDILLTCLP